MKKKSPFEHPNLRKQFKNDLAPSTGVQLKESMNVSSLHSDINEDQNLGDKLPPI